MTQLKLEKQTKNNILLGRDLKPFEWDRSGAEYKWQEEIIWKVNNKPVHGNHQLLKLFRINTTYKLQTVDDPEIQMGASYIWEEKKTPK